MLSSGVFAGVGILDFDFHDAAYSWFDTTLGLKFAGTASLLLVNGVERRVVRNFKCLSRLVLFLFD